MDWKLKKNALPQGSSRNYLDSLHNKYATPDEVLDDAEQIQAVLDAIECLRSFQKALENNDLLCEF